MEDDMAYFEIKNFSKSYEDAGGIQDVSFSLEKGHTLALLGHSGCGKTTLLRCINLLNFVDCGIMSLNEKILFDGSKRYREKDLRQIRQNFGLVFQSYNLFPQYTALKNVLLPLKLQDKEKVKQYIAQLKKEKQTKISAKVALFKKNLSQEEEQNAKELLTRVGLKDRFDHYPSQLSGGERQRVAIARALILNPKILCFDEPTSALDPELTIEVLKVIEGLKTLGTTMIIVTHEMQFAKRISDEVIFMSNGKIIEQGKTQDVFANPTNPLTKAFLTRKEDYYENNSRDDKASL
jgi:polar amino acid transport system ATP-binding protein